MQKILATCTLAALCVTAAGAHRSLFDAPGDPRVPVHDVAVGVLAQAESQLQAPVLGRGHGADLLGPRQVAGRHHGEGVGDLVAQALVGGDEGPDRVRQRARLAGRRCRADPRYGTRSSPRRR